MSTISESTLITGDIRADDDVTINGRVEGTIRLPESTVTIGASGTVNGDVHAREVQIQGTLQGKVYGQNSIKVAGTAKVRGSLLSPRVTLEEGAGFDGDVDTNVSLELIDGS